MPRYDYTCRDCGLDQERVHAMLAPVPRCQACGGVLKKVFRPTHFNMQGGGAGQDDPHLQYQFKHLYHD